MDDIAIYRELISLISLDGIKPSDIQKIKTRVSKKYGLSSIPKNSEILAAATEEERESLRPVLQMKPSRTISGVAPVAVMTSPHPCPHGKCLPCPGGPDHPFNSPQSYTGEEPAALRARQHEYDPYRQVQARLRQFEELGHVVDKVELIVMGGTMTARDLKYQEWFISECIRAMNEHSDTPSGVAQTYDELCEQNERSGVRCIGVTFETRPDWCKQEHIDRMLSLGVTKVELGVQQPDDRILEYNRRGHGVSEIVLANHLLREAGIKVGFHVMPNLPSATIEDDRKMFEILFSDSRFKPDFLKIYPTLVTPGSEIEDLWKKGEYSVYDEDELIDLIVYAKSILPEYVRISRIQRDIPAKLIVAGSHHSNFRQLCKNRLTEQGGKCRCIRCREAGRNSIKSKPVIEVLEYASSGGKEFFISITADDVLIGFIRLRFPKGPWREELDGAAIIRELHVYGSVVPLSRSGEGKEWQHRNFGGVLLKKAEDIACDNGYHKIAVMSGIGVRPYYHRHGYERAGPYMVKRL
ncbi:MAG: tRNA uridine(34) 5-carboxymethylaminomethyl modification radical SAM/GNAT enzyme Elp3 [Methanogenium sp.]|nr:tRNA uridine(34) 5-carboxymethylaminomethyl modification radical SAM/GNAT enzyme Elp3 [Methanogenium sp.]